MRFALKWCEKRGQKGHFFSHPVFNLFSFIFQSFRSKRTISKKIDIDFQKLGDKGDKRGQLLNVPFNVLKINNLANGDIWGHFEGWQWGDRGTTGKKHTPLRGVFPVPLPCGRFVLFCKVL